MLCLHSFICSGQKKSLFIDGRYGNYCISTQKIVNDLPKEVLFGVHVYPNGEVYFSMSDRVWFEKIFSSDSYGVSVDIISKTRYDCSQTTSGGTSIPRGVVLTGTYRKQLLANSSELQGGQIFTKIGKIPKSLIGKEVEGNVIILNGDHICYYTNFVDIDRNAWQLLPMGFYTDSLLNEYVDPKTKETDFFMYTRKIDIEIPFAKGSSNFHYLELEKYFDSINLSATTVNKVEIRAYSSIEGPEKTNKNLMEKRANSMISALKKYQPSLKRVNIITAENWLDFLKDIKNTKFAALERKSKLEIKKQLVDPQTMKEIEPILANHRKAIAILYLESKTPFKSEDDSSIVSQYRKAISSKQVSKAQIILKEISDRIMDNRLPIEFIDKIEVPLAKEYSPLLNDREVYKYLLKATDEYEAFDNLIEIRKIDPINGKLNYNICALRFFLWQFGDDSASKSLLLREIDNLARQGIPENLIKRLKINYYILRSEDQMKALDYAGKDRSLNEIRKIYETLKANDEEIYSLAKYYSYYSHMEWAQQIIEPRIGNINISENLIFYYLNLLFFQPNTYSTEEFKKAALNAINLNTKRFCNFFKPNDKGGASMQLLEYDQMKTLYCTECNK